MPELPQHRFNTDLGKRPLAEQKKTINRLLKAACTAGHISPEQNTLGATLARSLGTNGACTATRTYLATETGRSQRQIKRALARLRRKGILATDRQP